MICQARRPMPPRRDRLVGSGIGVALNWILSRRLLPLLEVAPDKVYWRYAVAESFNPSSVEKSAVATPKVVVLVAVLTPASVV
jgi:hypothetical protein